MTALVAKNVLDGSKAPATTTSEMKSALGNLRDFLAESLGTEGTAAFARNLATNGYYKLPGGLIIQWGEAGSASNGAVSVAFPTAMPNGVAHFAFTPRAPNFNVYSINKVGHSTAGFDAYVAYNGGGTALGFDWIAIGF